MGSNVISIETIKNKVVPVLKNYPVEKAILFGSYTEGKATVKSDIDLYIDTNGQLKGLDFVGLLEILVNTLGVSLDLIDRSHINPDSLITKEIENKGMVIYEKSKGGKNVLFSKEDKGNNCTDKDFGLSNTEIAALKILKEKIAGQFEITDVILYGSVACGKTDPESDIDLLILTLEPLSREKRHVITDIVFEINLEYNTNFSTLVIDKESWEKGYFSVLPIKEEILKVGLPL